MYEQNLRGKAGGHVDERSKRAQHAQSPQEATDAIAESHQKAQAEAIRIRESNRRQADNIYKHQKALTLIENAVNKVESKRGELKFDLNVHEKHGYEARHPEVIGRGPGGQAEIQHHIKESDFNKFNHADVDSDFEEGAVLADAKA